MAHEVQNLGQESLAIAADVTQISDVEQLAQRTQTAFGRIDILVNSAGGSTFSELDVISGTVGPVLLKPIDLDQVMAKAVAG